MSIDNPYHSIGPVDHEWEGFEYIFVDMGSIDKIRVFFDKDLADDEILNLLRAATELAKKLELMNYTVKR